MIIFAATSESCEFYTTLRSSPRSVTGGAGIRSGYPLPDRLDASPSEIHHPQYGLWCGSNQGTNGSGGSGSVCLGRRIVCNAASRLKGGCGQDCPPSKPVGTSSCRPARSEEHTSELQP